MARTRKIDIRVKKLNARIYALRSYYKTNYGLENLGLNTIKGAKEKNYKELNAEIKELNKQINSVRTSIRNERKTLAKMRKPKYVTYSEQVQLTRKDATEYERALVKENARRYRVAEQAFKYMSEVDRNPYATVEEFIEKADIMDIKPYKINAQGHTQESFEEFKEKRMRLWKSSSARTSQYKKNLFFALEHSDMPVDLQERFKKLISRLSNDQISVLAVGEEGFRMVFGYKYESFADTRDIYEELFDRLDNAFGTDKKQDPMGSQENDRTGNEKSLNERVR